MQIVYRSLIVFAFPAILATIGCTSSSKYESMGEQELQIEVATTYQAVPSAYKPTGDATADEALRGFWDAVKRQQPEIERARLALESSRTMQLVRRSVDAHFKSAGIEAPSSQQRQAVEAEIIQYMPPNEQREFASARASEKDKLGRDQAESLDAIVKLVRVSADVAGKVAAAKRSGAGGAMAIGSSVLGGTSAVKQLEPVTEYLDASKALFERYEQYFKSWDEQIERNMAKE